MQSQSAGGGEGGSERLKRLQQHGKLIQVVRQQADQIEEYKDLLERLRRKTYPMFEGPPLAAGFSRQGSRAPKYQFS